MTVKYIAIPFDHPDYAQVIEGGASASYLGATCEQATDLVYECDRTEDEDCTDVRHFHMVTENGETASDDEANRIFRILDARQQGL